MLLNPVNEGNNSNSSSNDATQNYQTNQHTTIGLNDQICELPQQSEAAVNTQLGAKLTFLQIIPVKLSNGHTFIETNALLDCGSDTTLLRKDVAQRLSLKGKQKKLRVTSTLSNSHNIDSATVSFDISSTSVSGCTQISTWVVHNLKIPFNQYDVSEIKKIHPHLKDIDFPVLKDSDVTLLIGTDHAHLLLHRDFRQGQNEESTAVKTTLDWVLMGGSKGEGENSSCNYIFGSLTNSEEKTLEPYGTLPNMSPELIPPNEKRSLEIPQKTKISKHNRIETALQFKREEPALPHNETPALNQYQPRKKFQKKQDFALLYRKQIHENILHGHAHHLSSKEVKTSHGITNYMPYHGVANINKPKSTNTCSNSTIKALNQRPRILKWCLIFLILLYFFSWTIFVDVQQELSDASQSL